MNATQKITRYGATLALALALVAAPVSAFAADDQGDDPSAAPFVLSTVDGGIQTAAGAAEFGLGIAAAASGEEGLGVAAGATDLGSQAVHAGLGIPQIIVGQP